MAPIFAASGYGGRPRLELPAADPFIAPIVHAAAVQLLTYNAVGPSGPNADQPRNLAKSVTVKCVTGGAKSG